MIQSITEVYTEESQEKHAEEDTTPSFPQKHQRAQKKSKL